MAELTTADPRVGMRNAAPVHHTVESVPATDVDDVLVFEHVDSRFRLIGGHGRGKGWAGVVDLDDADESLVSRAWRIGTILPQQTGESRHVAGPYYARNAVAVPIGQRHVVVLGATRPIQMRETDLVRAAATAVDGIRAVPADKLMADELEVVHALRALMAYRPLTVRDTVRHIATVTATALACEVALIGVAQDGNAIVERIDLGDLASSMMPLDAARYLADAARASDSVVEQAVHSGRDIFGVDVASRLTLQLGNDPTLGAMTLGHTMARPRGFTSLCQRIGRAMAEAAELLITQAMAREQLAAERDLLERISSTDALTGIPNRRRWDELVADSRSGDEAIHGYVLSCDLDCLKEANDRYGHAAGDALIHAAANLLTASVRDTDVVARVGGDEFAALLRGADAAAARRVVARIRRAESIWRVTEDALSPRLSIGVAPVVGNDLAHAHHIADRRMYLNKRRRAVTCEMVGPARKGARRRS